MKACRFVSAGGILSAGDGAAPLRGGVTIPPPSFSAALRELIRGLPCPSRPLGDRTMITSPAVTAPAAAGPYLAAVAGHLSGRGITSRLTSPAGTPVLTAAAPGGGQDPATVAIHPDPYAAPGASLAGQLDCTCTWTPASGTTPQATAAVIAAVLAATQLAIPGQARRPTAADAARLAGFLLCHPGWSVFWDPRYGLWRAAEDDPGSALYTETPDTAAVISYITGCF